MKIILVEPTDKYLLTPSLALRGNTLEPYACETIAAYVEKELTIPIDVIQQGDMNDGQLVNKLVDGIVKEDVKVIGFSVLTCNFHRVLQMAQIIKGRHPGIKIVLGGQHPSIDTENVINQENIDFVVFGEGEETFKELVEALKGNKNNFNQISGLAYKNNGKIKINKPRERISKLDLLQYAKRYPMIIKECRNWNLCYPPHEEQTGVAQIQYSRGCKFRCSFCVTPTLWRTRTDPQSKNIVTYRSPESVVKEMQYLKKNFGVNFFYFNDVTFNQDPQEMRGLCEEIIKKSLHKRHDNNFRWKKEVKKYIHWFCLAKIGINKEDARLLADAGCSKIGFGIESFNPKIAKKVYKKSYKFTEIAETLKNTDEVGIINRVYIVIGSPGETEDSINEILEGLKENLVDQIRVAFAVPYPGTPAHRKWETITDDYSRWTEDEPLVKCDVLDKKGLEGFKELRKKLIEDFYNSSEYKKRVKNKIKRFPYLKDSYRVFNNELRMLSGNRINILK